MDSDNNNGNNTWLQWSKYVLNSIESLTKSVEDIQKDISNNKIDAIVKLATLKEDIKKELESMARTILILRVKAGIIGAIFGILGSGVVSLCVYLIKEIIVKHW
jgi:hypothetical protein